MAVSGKTQPVGPSLHQALRDHIAWLKEDYGDSNGEVSAWGKVKIKQVETLLDRHDDMPRLANGAYSCWESTVDSGGRRLAR